MLSNSRAVQLLTSPGYSHILEDLHILTSALPDEDGGYFPALKEHYTEVRSTSTFSCTASTGADLIYLHFESSF